MNSRRSSSRTKLRRSAASPRSEVSNESQSGRPKVERGLRPRKTESDKTSEPQQKTQRETRREEAREPRVELRRLTQREATRETRGEKVRKSGRQEAQRAAREPEKTNEESEERRKFRKWVKKDKLDGMAHFLALGDKHFEIPGPPDVPLRVAKEVGLFETKTRAGRKVYKRYVHQQKKMLWAMMEPMFPEWFQGDVDIYDWIEKLPSDAWECHLEACRRMVFPPEKMFMTAWDDGSNDPSVDKEDPTRSFKSATFYYSFFSPFASAARDSESSSDSDSDSSSDSYYAPNIDTPYEPALIKRVSLKEIYELEKTPNLDQIFVYEK